MIAKGIILLGTLVCVWMTGCAGVHGDLTVQRPLVVADQLYWAGPEGDGNEAYSISAKFVSQSELTRFLRLDAPIGNFAGRQWLLVDVLVSIDLNGNGAGAHWIVSGPRPLILEYVADLKKVYSGKKAINDLSASSINVKPTAFFEKEE